MRSSGRAIRQPHITKSVHVHDRPDLIMGRLLRPPEAIVVGALPSRLAIFLLRTDLAACPAAIPDICEDEERAFAIPSS